MKTILFLFPDPITEARRDDLRNTINVVRSYLRIKTVALTIRKKDRDYLMSDNIWDDVIALDDEKLNLNDRQKELIDEKYRKYLLQKLKIKTESKGLQKIGQHANYSDGLIIGYLLAFEKVLSQSKYEYACLSLYDAHNSDVIPIMDAVCKENFVATIYITHPLQRFIVTDNMARNSEAIVSTYWEKCRSGLNIDQKEKVRLAKESYIRFKEGEQWLRHVEKKKLKKVLRIARGFVLRSSDSGLSARRVIHNILYRLYFKMMKTNSVRNYWESDDEAKSQENSKTRGNYFLLLMNKEDNYRLTYLSPFYSEMRSVIRNIAISIPLSHSLVIRCHPGSPDPSETVDTEVRQLGNVFFSRKDSDYFRLISGADLVFSIASSSFLDSILMGTPVITFGDSCFMVSNFGDLVPSCRSWEDLPQMIDEATKRGITEREADAAFYAFLTHSTPMKAMSSRTDWFDESPRIGRGRPWMEFERNNSDVVGHVLGEYLKKREKNRHC